MNGMMTKRMMRHGAGSVGLLVTGILVVALGLPGAGALLPREDAWAVIIATGNDGQVPEGLALHDWLIGHGWQDSHVKFLAAHTLADGPATMANIHCAISGVAAVSKPSSMIFISVLDEQQWSDGQVYFHAEDGLVSSVQLGGWINEIPTYAKMGVEVSGRYTAAFIPDLQGPNRVLVTSHSDTQDWQTNNYRLSVAFQSSCADMNGDGHISLQEAHNYEYQFIQAHFPGTQTPQMAGGGGQLILEVN